MASPRMFNMGEQTFMYKRVCTLCLTPPLHLSLTAYIDLARTYCAALEAKRKGDAQKARELTRKATKGYVALTDMPAILLLEELLALYPDAKYILVERNPETWAKSFAGIFDSSKAWYIPVLTAPWPRVRWLPTVVAHFQECADAILKEAGAQPGDYGPSQSPHEEFRMPAPSLLTEDRTS